MRGVSIIERVREQEVLAERFHQLDLHILQMLDVATLCRTLPQRICELFEVPHVWLTIIEDSSAARFMRGKGETVLLPRELFSRLLPQPQKPLVINDQLSDYYRLLPPSRREHFRSLAMVPLHLDGEAVGSLNQADPDPGRFSPHYNPIHLERLAVKLSLGLSNAIAHERLRHMAYQDPLTGLPNRRAMESSLAAELGRVDRYGRELALVFIDLDGFKGVNDSYGHDHGDALLQYLADGMRKMSRQSDLVTRLAGDEFVLLLPETDLQQAAELLQRMEYEFSRRPLVFKGATLPLRLSYGIASSKETDQALELLKLADSRLYAAKRDKQAL